MADFDYVIVGSGAGGGPLAANLARKGFKVMLLEAGGDPSKDSQLGRWIYEVPIFHGLATEFDECRWDYFVRHYADLIQQRLDSKFVKVDPATHKPLPLDEQGIWYPRAGTLGGCTAHYAMITVTPQDSDWNFIAELTGDMSWRAEHMNPYFARLENCHYQARPGSLSYLLKGILWSLYALLNRRKDWRDWAHGHGFGGWLTTSEASPLLVLGDGQLIHLLLTAFKIALNRHFEHPILALLSRLDPNSTVNNVNMREGIALTPMAVANGRRRGPRELLLETAAQHPSNLTIQLNVLASTVVFRGNRAVGVSFLEDAHLYKSDPYRRRAGPPPSSPKRREVSVNREVILCAGAFNSPQLLKLSGVGPRDELEKLGIKVVVDLPGVGRNLQDRYEIAVISSFLKPFTLLKGATFEPPQPSKPKEPAFQMWEKGKGLYCSNGSLIGMLKRSDPLQPEPDLYIFGLPGFFKGYLPGYSKLFERHKNQFTWVILKAYTHNFAGTVRLRSTDPAEWPEIVFNSFSAGPDRDADLAALVRGMEFVRGMNRTIGTKCEIVPGSAYNTPEKLREWIMNEAWGHHASCSNKIGAEGDPMAVLDSQFRVRGTQALRVVDASVFPKIPGYFIFSAIYMISEKAADVIPES